MLHVFLFGGCHIKCAGNTLPPIPGHKARSLFAYLVTHHQRPHTRDLLAGTFWPDLPDAQARRRLSHALWQIRHVLEPWLGSVPCLLTEADTIQVNPAASFWLDVAEFEKLVDKQGDKVTGRPGEKDQFLNSLSTRLLDLRQAIDIYRGDFLAGFYDDWAVIERERLRERFLDALSRLMSLYKGQGAYDEALRYARRLAMEDPLREEGHREIMRLCYLLGRGHEALQQYERCRAVLAQELGVEPTAATTTLYHEIAARSRVARTPYLPPASSQPLSPLLEGSGQVPLVGREQERSTLVRFVEQTIVGRGGIVLVEGEAGIGKTRLLQEVTRDAEWRAVRVLWGRGGRQAEPPPYGPLTEALRAGLSPLRAVQLAQLVAGVWLRTVSLLLPELTGWLPNLPPYAALEPEQERTRLLEALARVLLAMGRIAPHLLILDDLQWADEATLDALVYLARRLHQTGSGDEEAEDRLLVIGSYRGEEARGRAKVWATLQTLDQIGGHQTRLMLAPLTAAQTGELVRRGLGLRRAEL